MSDAKAHLLDEIENKSPHKVGMDQIAAYLKRDSRTVRKLINSGELKIKKVAGQFQATEQQLDRFIEDVQ